VVPEDNPATVFVGATGPQGLEATPDHRPGAPTPILSVNNLTPL